MATKRLKTQTKVIDSTDISNGYISLETTAISVLDLFRGGSNNVIYTQNSPSNGKVTLSDLQDGELIKVNYLY